MRIAICGGVAAVMLVLAPAYAQNKCVDVNGKVTYQTAPCPPAARAPTAPAAPTGPSLKQMSAEYAQMERCVADLEVQADANRRHRDELERRKREGQDTARDQVIEQQRVQLVISSYPQVCSKYGFEAPRDEPAAQRNAAVARDLQAGKMRTLRSEIQIATQREIGLAAARENEKNAARARPAREANDDWVRRGECTRSQLQIDQARMQMLQLSSEQAQYQSRYLDDQQRRLNEMCR